MEFGGWGRWAARPGSVRIWLSAFVEEECRVVRTLLSGDVGQSCFFFRIMDVLCVQVVVIVRMMVGEYNVLAR